MQKETQTKLHKQGVHDFETIEKMQTALLILYYN